MNIELLLARLRDSERLNHATPASDVYHAASVLVERQRDEIGRLKAEAERRERVAFRGGWESAYGGKEGITMKGQCEADYQQWRESTKDTAQSECERLGYHVCGPQPEKES